MEGESRAAQQKCTQHILPSGLLHMHKHAHTSTHSTSSTWSAGGRGKQEQRCTHLITNSAPPGSWSACSLTDVMSFCSDWRG